MNKNAFKNIIGNVKTVIFHMRTNDKIGLKFIKESLKWTYLQKGIKNETTITDKISVKKQILIILTIKTSTYVLLSNLKLKIISLITLIHDDSLLPLRELF